MGVDHTVYIMAGLNINEVCESKYITKYNEDTGKPYQKEVTGTSYYVGSKKFDSLADIEDYFSLDVINSVVGRVIVTVEANDFEEISPSYGRSDLNDVKEKFSCMGVKVKPSIFVVFHIG